MSTLPMSRKVVNTIKAHSCQTKSPLSQSAETMRAMTHASHSVRNAHQECARL